MTAEPLKNTALTPALSQKEREKTGDEISSRKAGVLTRDSSRDSWVRTPSLRQ